MTKQQQCTLLFVRTSDQWEEQDQYLIDLLTASEVSAPSDGAPAAAICDQVLVAAPTDADDAFVRTAAGQTTLMYPADQGLAGLLLAAKRLEMLPADSDLLVVSDQLVGPNGSLPDLGLPASDPAVIRTLVPPESRLSFTESKTLANPERAEALAMELTWVELPSAVLADNRFWRSLEKPAAAAEAEPGWLDLSGFAKAAELAGVPVEPRYVAPGDDFFARSLPTYLELGVPFVQWALFTTDPLVLERWSVVPRAAFEQVKAGAYPDSLFWNRILHSCPPQTWYTNLALLSIFPDNAPAGSANQLRTAAILHVFYPEMLDELLSYAGNLPDPVDLYVTTNTAEKKHELEQMLAAQDRFASYEVRQVTTNRGRDVSAFLLDCADVLQDPRYEVVAKLHSKKSVQDPDTVSAWFRDHLFQNLLRSPGYVQHIYQALADEPLLGLVMPPVIHMGVPTMGNGWTLNKGGAEELAPRLGIDIPFDNFTPLSPYGSMFLARRAALEPLVNAAFTVEEYPDAADYRDGSVAHVLERLFSYVVFSQGYYARCVQSAAQTEVSATALQYKYDQVSHYLFPFASRQVKMLQADGPAQLGVADIRSIAQRQLSEKYPRVGGAALSGWMFGKRIGAAVKRRVKRLLGR